MGLCTSEEVVDLLRQAVAQRSRGPRAAVEAYLNLISSDPLLHIRIRELRERALAVPRGHAGGGRTAPSAPRAATHASS